MEEPDFDSEEWMCEFRMGIRELRMLHSHLLYSIEVWPGSPRRPTEEQEFLQHLKVQTFAMIADHSFHNLDQKND